MTYVTHGSPSPSEINLANLKRVARECGIWNERMDMLMGEGEVCSLLLRDGILAVLAGQEDLARSHFSQVALQIAVQDAYYASLPEVDADALEWAEANRA